MDGKKIAIGVLVVLAVLLGGLVTSGLRHERAAYGQSSVFARYLATAAEVRENFVNFVILDTDSRRVIFYNMAPPNYKLDIGGGYDLNSQFRRTR
jgi:hypothetical protein